MAFKKQTKLKPKIYYFIKKNHFNTKKDMKIASP